MTSTAARLLRDRTGAQRVTNIELFFDLVYVFAVTQLAGYLSEHVTLAGALRSVLLLAMVWLCWAYTAWVTNWMDPDHLAVRVLLVVLTMISLAMSAALPFAFGTRGWLVGACYALSQVGRSVFMVIALRGERLRRNFERILIWTLVSGGFAIAGSAATGHARETLWVLAAGTDLLGGMAGFWVPGLGRSLTTDWTISGGHFAERCQAFILIALGESVVRIGETASQAAHFTIQTTAAFVVACIGTVTFWWIYFDRGADAAAAVIEASHDPGRLGRDAYHLIHPVMVAGIIVLAAGDEALAEPSRPPGHVWLFLGGPALFLAGNAAFKYDVWRIVPWSRIAGVAAFILLALAGRTLPELALGSLGLAVVVAIAAYDRIHVKAS
jgi:low temperature requirement protein LtrA